MWLSLVALGLGTSALAQEGPVFNLLIMPLTPSSETRDRYHTLVKHKGAGEQTWTSDTPGFTCSPAGDYVEVAVEAASWPSHVPARVECTGSSGKVAKAKVRIRDSVAPVTRILGPASVWLSLSVAVGQLIEQA